MRIVLLVMAALYAFGLIPATADHDWASVAVLAGAAGLCFAVYHFTAP